MTGLGALFGELDVLQDNGVHEFYEDDRLLVLRNHGSKVWWALTKLGGGHQVVGDRGFPDIHAAAAAGRKALEEHDARMKRRP